MALKTIEGLFDDAGNSDFPHRRINEDSWDLAISEVKEDEVLVGLFWCEPGSNEEMVAAVIKDRETLEELHALPERLWQCWIALSKETAEELGLL